MYTIPGRTPRTVRLPDPLTEYLAGKTGEEDRIIVISDELAVVASKTEPGAWHLITWENDGPHCTCRGFYYRGICRHHKLANDVRLELAARAMHS
jgi:hypothetical protein